MNYSTAILVMNEKARCVKVTYENVENATKEMFKTFDASIKVDDYVIVPTNTRHNLTVSKVVEVDTDDWMDTSSPLGWLVGRVDMADANQIKTFEEKAIGEIKIAEKLKRRREMQASIKEALAESGGALQLLSASPADIEEDTAEQSAA